MLNNWTQWIGLYLYCFSSIASAAGWDGKVTISGETVDYQIRSGQDTSTAKLCMGQLEGISIPTLDDALRGGEERIRAQNCVRACMSPLCCFFPLLGIAFSSDAQNKIGGVRQLIKAAYNDDREELTSFKSRVIEYLDGIASGDKAPPLFDEISQEESARWRNMELEEVARYIRRINLAGCASLGEKEFQDGFHVDVVSCCCCSMSDVHLDLDTLAQSTVRQSQLFGGNLESQIQARLDRRVTGYVAEREALEKAQRAAGAGK